MATTSIKQTFKSNGYSTWKSEDEAVSVSLRKYFKHWFPSAASGHGIDEQPLDVRQHVGKCCVGGRGYDDTEHSIGVSLGSSSFSSSTTGSSMHSGRPRLPTCTYDETEHSEFRYPSSDEPSKRSTKKVVIVEPED